LLITGSVGFIAGNEVDGGYKQRVQEHSPVPLV
jgi:hypothetical protein